MSSVFFSFLLAPDRVSKEFGLLLGVAILTDALLMRMTLVPALLTLLGERSWWIPGGSTVAPEHHDRAAGRAPGGGEPAGAAEAGRQHRLLAPPRRRGSSSASAAGRSPVGASTSPVRSANACWKSSRETSPFA